MHGPDADRGPSCLRKQKASDRLGIHLGGRGHPFMCLPGQRLDADIRQDGGEGIGDVEVARAFGADLEQHWDA